MGKSKSGWLKRLTEACTPITEDQFKKVLDHCKWVKLKSVANGFDETFSKYKNS